MRYRRWLLLALFLLASPAFAADFRSGTEATNSVVTGLQRGATGYASFTASGSAFVGVAQCARATGSVVCNLAASTDHDCAVVFWRCPAGVSTADPLVCRVDTYQDGSGTWQSEVTGDVSRVRDLNEIDPTPNLVAVVTTVAQTTRVQVDCR